jgi:hypothetical protein
VTEAAADVFRNSRREIAEPPGLRFDFISKSVGVEANFNTVTFTFATAAAWLGRLNPNRKLLANLKLVYLCC